MMGREIGVAGIHENRISDEIDKQHDRAVDEIEAGAAKNPDEIARPVGLYVMQQLHEDSLVIAEFLDDFLDLVFRFFWQFWHKAKATNACPPPEDNFYFCSGGLRIRVAEDGRRVSILPV